ncbi:hypothetical protein [Enterococcus crotali]|uniref:hypothetical protein n=1 Tax=Enterococcus crotali TaxID=1453587 RepID=UPI000471DA58|nr:hypothetical protein [Enterococcus crotali]
MKTIKGMMLGILFSAICLSYSTVSFAEEINSGMDRAATETSETRISEAQKEIDTTPHFKIKELKAVVGDKGMLEVEQIEGLKDLKGTFKATVADQKILSINAQGEWQALSAGNTKATLDFEWDKASLEKIQEKYPEYKLIKKDLAQEISVEVTAVTEVDITPEYNVGTISAKLGETGQFSVAPMGGVTTPKGTFTAYIPDGKAKDIISVDATGKWTALKAGTTEFILDFKLSDESYKEIQDKNPGSTLMSRDIARSINVEVKPAGVLDITPIIDSDSITGKVDDTGQLKVKPIEGIEDTEGSFVTSIADPSIIEIDAAGKWTALKAGTTDVTITYNWSDETMKKLAEKYPGYEFSTKETAQVIKVTITENTTGSTKPVGTTKPVGKQLPATNDASSNSTWMVGVLMLVLVALGWSKREALTK